MQNGHIIALIIKTLLGLKIHSISQKILTQMVQMEMCISSNTNKNK